MKSKSIFFALNLVFVLNYGKPLIAQYFPYQSIVKDNKGNSINNKNIGFRITILLDKWNTKLYSESHTVMSSDQGKVTLMIGKGKRIEGDFQKINWSNTPFQLKIETDLQGGENYKITNTVVLNPLPYAIQAQNGAPFFDEKDTNKILAYCDNELKWVKNGCPPKVEALICNSEYSYDKEIFIRYDKGNKGYLESGKIKAENYTDVFISNEGQFLFNEGGSIKLKLEGYTNYTMEQLNKKNMIFNYLLNEKKCSFSIKFK
jgi:hypothetical protein